MATEADVVKEIKHTLKFLMKLDGEGPTCHYGVFFNDTDVGNTLETPFATLKACKRRGYVTFEGEMLFQGTHDGVLITVTEEGQKFMDS
eukprot:CAMPEP_0174893076 /NCGR_PEP_ID=MMETSP0167-20121228/7917_1 /TAXON_ID=38298 /ORGANISM="Rhodella maculata, Strain CCMP736" /LENGTH=88 /DNA_ID=CAMNT_0016131747 /DNA_START=58 /DNA_END=324 /DNA_ORIENTATION=+